MTRAFTTLGLMLIVLLVVSWQTMNGNRARIGRERDDQAIRKLLADFVEAWNKHDTTAFSLVFAEDADFTNVRASAFTVG